jgi:YwiC-like protein
MSEPPGPARDATSVRIRPIALPAEHGAWGLLAESVLLGLLVAPSRAGLGVAAAGIGAFLLHHPLKLVWRDRRARRRLPRTRVALRFAGLYSAIALAGIAIAGQGAEGWWVPLAMAAPLAVAQFRRDVALRGRRLAPELMAAAAFGALAAAILRAAGLPGTVALASWALLAAQAISAVLYVRTRLRLARGGAERRASPVLSHLLACSLAIGLWRAGLAPWTAPWAFAALLFRAIHGTSRNRGHERPERVGALEAAYGTAAVIALAAGYRS